MRQDVQNRHDVLQLDRKVIANPESGAAVSLLEERLIIVLFFHKVFLEAAVRLIHELGLHFVFAFLLDVYSDFEVQSELPTNVSIHFLNVCLAESVFFLDERILVHLHVALDRVCS